jgi:hypothetical protein
MAKSIKSGGEASLPYRVIIDFLEGTLKKQDAIAFARGFIEHHFDAPNACGYYVMPYEQGYVFEVHEGGEGKAFLPGIMDALDQDPTATACIQMARRVLEVKRSAAGTYTAILLPEGMDSQSLDKVFPEAGAALTPFQKSGLTALIIGGAVFGLGFIALFLTMLYYLIQVTGLLSPPLAAIDFRSLPLTQWPSLETKAGEESGTYIKTLRYQNGSWQEDEGKRIELQGTTGTAAATATATETNPLLPPSLQTPAASTAPKTIAKEPAAIPAEAPGVTAPPSIPAPANPAPPPAPAPANLMLPPAAH